ncbi:MAG: galactokinase [Chloroflexi bacterium]|nr:MAG: galactokinase [Chloroflexota bacterium]
MDPQRILYVRNAFARLFDTTPTVWTRAPGRVDLMGSHTDYNMGYVLTMTIDRDTWLAARPRGDRQVRVASLNIDGVAEFDLDHITRDERARWSNYVRGVALALQEAGYELTGFDGLVHSTVPFGSGLSSSAAIEMATAVLFKTLGNLDLDPVKMALLGQRAENRFVGINSGILDQYSSALGREGCALLLDCRALTSETMQVPAGMQLVICDTRAKRELTGSEYDERRAQCEEGARILAGFYPHVEALRDVTLEQFEAHEQDLPPVVAKRCRFVIEENQRVLDLAAALPRDDRAAIRALMQASYEGARELYEIVNPEMEAMMEAMSTGPGVIGARQAGAGFGGCMVAMVEKEDVPAFAEHVRSRYEKATGITPQVYPVRAAAGAGPFSPS